MSGYDSNRGAWGIPISLREWVDPYGGAPYQHPYPSYRYPPIMPMPPPIPSTLFTEPQLLSQGQHPPTLRFPTPVIHNPTPTRLVEQSYRTSLDCSTIGSPIPLPTHKLS